MLHGLAGGHVLGNAVSTPSEKRPLMQTKMRLGKRLEKTITNTPTESPPQTPQEKQMAAKSFETLTPLEAFRPPGKDESVSLGVRMSQSESMFHKQSSVETLYVSPSFKLVSPEKETRTSKDLQTPAQSRIYWMEDVSLKPLAMQVSTASEAASSFSSLSSPDLAHPEKSAPHSPLVLSSPSFRTQPPPHSSSAHFTHKNEAARVHHPCAPRGTASSDDKKYPDISDDEEYLDSPDNSDLAMEKPDHIPRSNQVAFPTATRTCLPSVSQAVFQTSEGLSGEFESSSIHTLLGEVRAAVLHLHEDLSLVIQELGVINNHLDNLSIISQAASKAPRGPQSSRGSSDP
ncbi:hypothetical protein STEG23_034335 [Scotinomys teguina]